MAPVYSATPILIKFVLVINDDIIILHRLILLLKQILFVFVLFLVIIGSITYDFIRKKQIHIRDILPAQSENEFIDVIEQQQKVTIVPHISEVINQCCELPSEISLNNISLDKKISTRSSRQLICYCDGSYSYQSQIGYSGFRASDGFSEYRLCHVRHPRRGSTESEVFAACLALQYASIHHYDTLILYKDDSKVEQLLNCPKKKDYYNYPMFFQILKKCYRKIKHFVIRVEHVRGHTTCYEQQQCSIKREFATVDRQVRRKRRQHEQCYYSKNNIVDPCFPYYLYQYGGRYIRFIHPEKFGATLIITSSRQTLSAFWTSRIN